MAVATVAALLAGALGGAVPVQAGHNQEGCSVEDVLHGSQEQCVPNVDIVPDVDPEVGVELVDQEDVMLGDKVFAWVGLVKVTAFETFTVPSVGQDNPPCDVWRALLFPCEDNDPLGVGEKGLKLKDTGVADQCLYEADYKIDVDGDGTWDYVITGYTVDPCGQT